jgi:uncharacterized protein
MNRRRFLGGAALGSCAFVLTGCPFSFEQGLYNDCRATGTQPVLRNPLVLAAWNGLRPDFVWDCHVHLFGNGGSRSGIYVNPQFNEPATIAGKVRRAFFMNAGCGGADDARLDEGVVARLARLMDDFPPGAKAMLLAFDFTYDADGKRREDLTTFSVSNDYAARIARTRPDRFEWIASVHPARADAVAALEDAKRNGARAVKWLPQSMAIDMRSNAAKATYATLARLDLPLLVHVGEEQAVEGAKRHDLGNPLFLRHALDAGVRVIAAHCATLGESADLDASHPLAPEVANLDLLARLFAERRYDGLLFADISAVAQANRAESLPRLVSTKAWHARLLNGSDYPLPGIMPLFSVGAIARAGLIEPEAVPVLKELRHVNPLLFDFVLKRSLHSGGQRLPASVFETRTFFERTTTLKGNT